MMRSESKHRRRDRCTQRAALATQPRVPARPCACMPTPTWLAGTAGSFPFASLEDTKATLDLIESRREFEPCYARVYDTRIVFLRLHVLELSPDQLTHFTYLFRIPLLDPIEQRLNSLIRFRLHGGIQYRRTCLFRGLQVARLSAALGWGSSVQRRRLH